MKHKTTKTALLLTLLFLAFVAHAQKDVIVLKNGDMIERAKVLDVTETDIDYKVIAHHTPRDVQTIPKSQVFMIKYYESGRNVVINSSSETSNTIKKESDNKQPTATTNETKENIVKSDALSQQDKIYIHNGTAIEGTVLRVAEFRIIFIYKGETSQQVVSKYAVEKIVHGSSGRVENITDKIIVRSKNDWENVVILNNEAEVTGLTKVDEVQGRTKGFSSMLCT